MLFETFRLALRAIARNLLRSLLTVLGIVIGVGAVIALVTIGRGTSAKVEAEIAALGVNMLTISAGQRSSGSGGTRVKARGFSPEDVEAVEVEISGIAEVAPVMTRTLLVVASKKNWATKVVGSTADYFTIRNRPVARGRTFRADEQASGQPVCVIGQTVRQKLFGRSNPIDQSIRIRRMICQVIGVMERKGEGGAEASEDDAIVIPLRAFRRSLAGKRELNTIVVSAQSGASTDRVKGDLEAFFRERRRIAAGQDDDFMVSDMKALAATMTGTSNLLTGLLVSVAAVSLLVGGIGIMNIMLVSVTERTREIGVRLAIGAMGQQVLAQFLIEAVTLSVIGGLMGIALGLALALAAVPVLDIPFVLDPTVMIVAVGFSALVGVAFGFLPARHAARLDPIVALRHE